MANKEDLENMARNMVSKEDLEVMKGVIWNEMGHFFPHNSAPQEEKENKGACPNPGLRKLKKKW